MLHANVLAPATDEERRHPLKLHMPACTTFAAIPPRDAGIDRVPAALERARGHIIYQRMGRR